MADPIVFGFPRSTFVNIVRLVLTHKEVPYTFEDLEPEMGKAKHLALHPFNRVPILRHDDFTIYETTAIVSYIEETFPQRSLQPKGVRDRARMNQWISSVNSYYYPYMIYHVSHERIVPNPRLLTSILCQAPMASVSRRKPRPCTRSIRRFPAGARPWKPCRPLKRFAQRYRRAGQSSMQGNGPCRIGRNTERHQLGVGARSLLPVYGSRGMQTPKGSSATSP